MEILCEKDCRSCLAKDCPQRRCSAIRIIVPPQQDVLPEDMKQKTFDMPDQQKANLFG